MTRFSNLIALAFLPFLIACEQPVSEIDYTDPDMTYYDAAFTRNDGNSSTEPAPITYGANQPSANGGIVKLGNIRYRLPRGWFQEGADVKAHHGMELRSLHQFSNRFGEGAISYDRIKREHLMPQLNKYGLTIVSEQKAPSVANCYETQERRRFDVAQMRRSYETNAYVVSDKSGNRAVLLAIHVIFASDALRQAGTTFDLWFMPVDVDYVAHGISELISVFSTWSYDDTYMQQYNFGEQQKYQSTMSSIAASRRRDQAGWAATQSKIQADYAAASAATAAVGRSQARSFDRSSTTIVNGIRETAQTIDPWTGNQVDLQNGSQRYFIDRYGNQISTDDLFYEPGSDLNYGSEIQEVYPSGY